MKLTIKFILTLLIVFFYADLFSQKTLELKNSNLEGVSPRVSFGGGMTLHVKELMPHFLWRILIQTQAVKKPSSTNS